MRQNFYQFSLYKNFLLIKLIQNAPKPPKAMLVSKNLNSLILAAPSAYQLLILTADALCQKYKVKSNTGFLSQMKKR